MIQEMISKVKYYKCSFNYSFHQITIQNSKKKVLRSYMNFSIMQGKIELKTLQKLNMMEVIMRTI